jgi:hypothetical protein
MSQHDHHSVRRVVLPSGKTIEVVYFEDQPAVVSSATREQATAGLHVCPHCDAETVYPVEWSEAGPEHWEMTLRCPNCEWLASGIFEQELVERLEEELDAGTEELIRDLKRLTHANMEEEIELFAGALAADHILPMDF